LLPLPQATGGKSNLNWRIALGTLAGPEAPPAGPSRAWTSGNTCDSPHRGDNLSAMAGQLNLLTGGCHCGAVAVRFETPNPPESLTVRACQCSFCRRHGALSISDPAGRIAIEARDPALLKRYRFGLKTADFLLCSGCGVYLGAVMPDGDQAYGILNLLCLEQRDAFGGAGEPMDYDAETDAERRARRRAKWTPVTGYAPD